MKQKQKPNKIGPKELALREARELRAVQTSRAKMRAKAAHRLTTVKFKLAGRKR
jgi:hypothetical protein